MLRDYGIQTTQTVDPLAANHVVADPKEYESLAMFNPRWRMIFKAINQTAELPRL